MQYVIISRSWSLLGFAALVACAAGCGASSKATDPCDGQPGACIGLRVEGSVSPLDKLSIYVGAPVNASMVTPMSTFTLPAKVALILPAGTTGSVAVSVDGLDKGVVKGQGGGTVILSALGRGQLTVTLTAPGGDLGMPEDLSLRADSAAAPDLFLDGDALACNLEACGGSGGPMNGCCPAGCNANNDPDCQPVCGNGVIEAGEVCDDHNTANGDSCDPTCRYTNSVITLAGVPNGNNGFADGTGAVARLNGAGNFLYGALDVAPLQGTAGTAYFLDLQTLRAVDLSTNTVAVVAGAVGQAGHADSAAGSLGLLNSPSALAVTPSGQVYISENGTTTGTVLRLYNGGTGALTTALGPGSNWPGQVHAMHSFSAGTPPADTHMMVLDANGLEDWDLTAATTSSLLAGAAVAGCTDVAYDPANSTFYLTCTTKVASAVKNALTLTTVGGNGTAACTNGSPGNVKAADSIAYLGGQLLFTDRFCDSLEGLSGSTITTVLGTLGTQGSTDSPFLFYDPSYIAPALTPSGKVLVLDSASLRTITPSPAAGVTSVGIEPYKGPFVFTGPFTSLRLAGVSDPAATNDGIAAYFLADDGTTSLFKANASNGTSSKLASFATGHDPSTVTLIGTTLFLLSGIDQALHNLPTTGGAEASPQPLTGVAGVDFQGNATTDWPTQTAATASLYVLGSSGQVLYRVSQSGSITVLAGTAGSSGTQDGTGAAAHIGNGIAVASDGKTVFFLDAITAVGSNGGLLLRAVDISSGVCTTLAGGATAGHVDGLGGVGTATRLSGARSLTTDGASVFIADAGQGPYYTAGNPASSGTYASIRQYVLATRQLSTMIGAPLKWTVHNGVGVQAFVNRPTTLLYNSLAKALLFYDDAEGVLQGIN